jgi:hypothetical protein
MSILKELNDLLTAQGVSVETGVFKGKAPDEYVVVVPLSDTYGLCANDCPQYEVQEARLSLFSKNNYMQRKNQIVKALLAGDLTVTDRTYVGFEEDTSYHLYEIDVAKTYEVEGED